MIFFFPDGATGHQVLHPSRIIMEQIYIQDLYDLYYQPLHGSMCRRRLKRRPILVSIYVHVIEFSLTLSESGLREQQAYSFGSGL